jgi:MFS family permease
MTVAPVERSVASAAYGFVRFIGGGLAPFFAGKIAERWGVHVPFYVGAFSVVLAIAVLSTGHPPAQGRRAEPGCRADRSRTGG